MFRILLILLICAVSAFSQKVLHVSTIPGHADLYYQDLEHDHTRNPHYHSPAFIPVHNEDASEGFVLVSVFSPGFADTTMQVKLSEKDTSYLIVSLRPLLSEPLLEKQQSELSKRSRRNFGYKLMYTSIIPFGVSLAAGAFTYYNINKAEEKKDILESSRIYSDSHVQQVERDFKDYRDNAKTGKATTVTSFIVGASLLSIGFILSF